MSEKNIYDALVRHQIYLEGYKAQLGSRFDPTAKAIEDDFRKAIAGLDYDKLDEMSKTEVRRFIANLKDLQLRHYDDYYFDLLKELKKFAKVDHGILSSIFGKKDTFPATLYNKIKDLPMGGVGEYMEKFLRNVGLGQIVKFEKIVLGAWADGNTKAELLVKLIGEKVTEAKQKLLNAARAKPSIVGKLKDALKRAVSGPVDVPPSPVPSPAPVTPPKPFIPPAPAVAPRPIPVTSDTVGGLINQARVQNQAAIDTALQHISQGISSFVAEKYSNYYQWISVIDKATTDVCRGRDGTVYRYGEGPMPPAHVRCRSIVVPWYNRGDIDITPGEDYEITGAPLVRADGRERFTRNDPIRLRP